MEYAFDYGQRTDVFGTARKQPHIKHVNNYRPLECTYFVKYCIFLY